MNQSGQESVPFELLVTIIIMGFVIFVGLHALQQLSEAQCFAKVERGLEDFKVKMEVAVTQKSPQTIFFRLSNCFNPEEEQVWVQNWDSPVFCADLCGSAEISCTALEYKNTATGQIRSSRKCLNISPETVFPAQENPGRCTSIDTADQQYELHDLKNAAPQGTYLLVNKTFATDIFPTICAYERV
jgi:type II secretory pathway pseudopilin PulG